MKASSLVKKGKTLEEIYKLIEQANERGECMCYFPCIMYVSDDVRLQLIKDGFKVREGLMFHDPEMLIIEW